MGWLVLITINPLRAHVAANGVFWLFAGGAAYTAGVAFFAADCRFRVCPANLAFVCHGGRTRLAVLRYAA